MNAVPTKKMSVIQINTLLNIRRIFTEIKGGNSDIKFGGRPSEHFLNIKLKKIYQRHFIESECEKFGLDYEKVRNTKIKIPEDVLFDMTNSLELYTAKFILLFGAYKNVIRIFKEGSPWIRDSEKRKRLIYLAMENKIVITSEMINYMLFDPEIVKFNIGTDITCWFSNAEGEAIAKDIHQYTTEMNNGGN